MSIANSTLHFHFPLVVGTDRPLFEDYNQAMETLDEKLYESISTLETIPQEITDLQTAVNGISEQITALETFETEQTGTNQLVNNAILALQQAVATIPTKFDSAGIADPYDAEHGTYNVGDVVTHNGQRYECSHDVTAAEPFDADKWLAMDVQTVITEIKSDLSNLDTEIAGKQDSLTSALDYNVNGITVVSYGNIVSINSINATFANVSDVFIPPTDRPSRAYPFSAIVFNGTALVPYKGVVNVNGSISLYDKDGNTPASSDQCIIGVTYIKG